MQYGDDPRTETLRGLSALADEIRRRLYDFVASHDEPITRDLAASHAGISRTLAAYHLDILVDAGLLGTTFARRDGATGPGAGRPAKHYFRITEERSISVPPRDYELLADLLSSAVDDDDSTGVVRDALMDAAKKEGRRAGAEAEHLTDDELVELLRKRGYEPEVTGTGDIDMRNCPFHRLSRTHTDLVCGLNHALLEGVLDGGGDDASRAELCPREGRCCVVIRAAAETSQTGHPQAS